MSRITTAPFLNSKIKIRVMSIEKFQVNLGQMVEKMSEKVESKTIGFNIWKPDIDIGPYRYILINKSKTQSYLVGIEGKMLKGLAPLEKIEFEGKDDLKFEYWTAKLISQGEIGVKVQKLEIEKQEEIKEKSNTCKICGRKISPRNKNKICQYCREK